MISSSYKAKECSFVSRALAFLLLTMRFISCLVDVQYGEDSFNLINMRNGEDSFNLINAR